MSIEPFARPAVRRVLRTPVIFRKAIPAIHGCRVHVVALRRGVLEVAIVLGDALIGARTAHDSTRTVEGVPRPARYHHPAIDIHVREADAYCQHRRVVFEEAARPAAADESGAVVPESVVHASIKSDVRTPVPGMPEIGRALIAPISGRPQQTRLRRRHPHAGNPVVTDGGVVIGPESRRP